MSFFFSKQAAKKFVDVDLLHKMECKLCPLYNLPGNKNKDIKPHGAAQPQVYILGVGPRDIDDKTGKFYAGVGGQYLKSCFTEQQINKVRYNNITRTKATDFKPPFEAIEACRPSVEKDILASQPRIILGLGDEVLNWVQRSKVTLSAWRGHPFPVQILGHTSWFYPTFNPDSILESEVKNKLDPVFKLDIKNLYKFLSRDLEPYVVPKTEIFTNVHILNNLADIKSALLKLYKEPSTVTDLETTAKDVYEKDSKILSFAIGTIDYTISFGYQHPQAGWTPEEFQQLKKLLHWFYKNKKQRKTAHNAGFEISWLVKEFDDPEIAYSNWHDTMSSSYCLGYGGNSKESDDGSEKVFKGLLSLDSLVKVHFGFDLKIASNLNRSDLIHEDLGKVLLYGGGDTKWTDGVRLKLDADVEYQGLRSIVNEHDRRIPSVALMRRKGLVYDLSRAKTHEADLESKISKIYTESMNHPSAIEYKSKFKKFDIGSPADVANILEYLKFDVYRVNKDGTKKKSSDDGILKAIDHPIAKNVLTYRELTKAKSTYVDIFIPGAGKNYVVYPDGLVHSNFTTHFTTTGRTSSNDPNLQNFPKRKNKDIRDIIVAPPGHIFASADFGQLEYRVLVMATKDQKLVDYVWNGTDIHADWSMRIAKKLPKRVGGVEVLNRWVKGELATLKNTDKLFKAFRDIVKNNFVFAAFYGAGIRKLAQAMVLPENVVKDLYEEFWEEFSEVHAWHKWAYEFYAQHGYIETLTGRRRYAPIEGGEIINMPIQGSGSDIVIDGMCRLSEYALETGQPQYQPVLNIHDDLSFYLPEVSWQKDLDKIIEIMLDCRYPWINVPLAVEASKGPDWFHQEEYGTFDNSKQLKERLASEVSN